MKGYGNNSNYDGNDKSYGGGRRGGGDFGGKGGSFRGGKGGLRGGRPKICRFCKEDLNIIDYKDIRKLGRYLSDRGKIVPRRVTGACLKHQRKIATALKRARMMALLPYVTD